MELRHAGLVLSIRDNVYPPAEDSFMLADAASGLSGKRVLEIGCGSGIASLAFARNGCEVLGVDINPVAVKCAQVNAKKNKISGAAFVQGDLFSSIPSNSHSSFDVILFNPPYLPTSEEEKLKGDINHAYDGGKDGREVLERFLAEFDRFLAPGGVLFIIQSSLNDLDKTQQYLESKGFKVEIVKEEKFFFERLMLIRAIKCVK